MLTREQIDEADFKATDLFFNALMGFYDFSQLDALDMFARDGTLTVCRYADKVKSLALWEINPEWKDALSKFGAKEVHIGCSHEQMFNSEDKFSFIVVDAPQGVYTDWRGTQHSEHFDLIPDLPQIMQDRCIIVMYVNKKPYDASQHGDFGRDVYPNYSYQKWMDRRAAFYDVDDASEIDIADAMLAYRTAWKEAGYKSISEVVISCYDMGIGMPPSFRVAFELVKV